MDATAVRELIIIADRGDKAKCMHVYELVTILVLYVNFRLDFILKTVHCLSWLQCVSLSRHREAPS